MLFTLAAVVFISAIFVFFSQEFVRAVKKFFAIWGMKTIVPLGVASWLAFNFEYWILLVLRYYREFLKSLVAVFVWIIPSQQFAYFLGSFLVLTIISVVPVFLAELIIKKKTYKSYAYPYVTSTMIWLVSALILVIPTR